MMRLGRPLIFYEMVKFVSQLRWQYWKIVAWHLQICNSCFYQVRELWPMGRLFNLVICLALILLKCIDSRVPCVRNSYYTFMSGVLKPCKCLNHGLKRCMWFVYKLFSAFYLFFCQAPIPSHCTLVGRYAWHFTSGFVMVWTCACDLGIILKFIFVFFSTFWTLSVLCSNAMKVPK